MRWGNGSIRHARRRRSDRLYELAGALWLAIAILALVLPVPAGYVP